jgi:hypothetical protein
VFGRLGTSEYPTPLQGGVEGYPLKHPLQCWLSDQYEHGQPTERLGREPGVHWAGHGEPGQWGDGVGQNLDRPSRRGCGDPASSCGDPASSRSDPASSRGDPASGCCDPASGPGVCAGWVSAAPPGSVPRAPTILLRKMQLPCHSYVTAK